MIAELSRADRVRRLPRAARVELYQRLRELDPAALASLRYAWESFFAHPWQILSETERRAKLIVFAGDRGDGKTRAAVELFVAEILAGRARRPRIIASKSSDVWGPCVFGESGIASCLPPWVPFETIETSKEAPAGIVVIAGVKVACFGAHDEEATTAYAGDLDFYDDLAKWRGPGAERAYQTARLSCRIGRGVGIVATTSKGLRFLHRAMAASKEAGDDHVVVKRGPRFTNAHNLTGGYYARIAAEQGESALDDVGTDNPFAGLAFDEHPIRVAEAGDLDEIAICVDPADGKGPSHDDWGIGALGKRRGGHLVALEDASGDFDDTEAGEAVLALYERWRGRARRVRIVVESNRGPRATTAIRAGYLARELRALEANEPRRPMPEIVGVKRDRDKATAFRAIVPLYRSALLHHVAGLDRLEAQLRACDPGSRRPKVDDRIDWLTTGAHQLAELAVGAEARQEAQREERASLVRHNFATMVAAQERIPAPTMGVGWDERA